MSNFTFFNPQPKQGKKPRKPKRPIRKHSKKWRPATPEELAHLERVKLMPCCCCGRPPPSIAHHIKCGKRKNHKKTIPLCDMHHKDESGLGGGKQSVHKDKKGFIAAFGTEEELLIKTELRLGIRVATPEISEF